MTKIEKSKAIKTIRGIQSLLDEFGVEAYAFNPGVRGRLKICKNVIDFGTYEWKWLEPLLRELSLHRKLAIKKRKPKRIVKSSSPSYPFIPT